MTDLSFSFSENDMRSISVAHRPTKTWSDWVAASMVRFLRFGMDTATGYRHDKEVFQGSKDPKSATAHQKYTMTERKWLVRFVFLESVAGVPGMVGGMLRHLHSLRRMKRDNGWLVPHVFLVVSPKQLMRSTGSKPSLRKPTTSGCTCSPFSRWLSRAGSCV